MCVNSNLTSHYLLCVLKIGVFVSTLYFLSVFLNFQLHVSCIFDIVMETRDHAWKKLLDQKDYVFYGM